MKAAPLHPFEEQRLKALEELKILDTLSEIEFDQITKIAAQICETPIALISLVDDHRQWFKSKQGLDAKETPKEVAFCAHAILEKKVFVIEDAKKDERFHDNPLVIGSPFVHFYAGAPLMSPGQLPIGTLCVIDHKPKKLKPEQLEALQALSDQVTRLLQMRQQVMSLSQANQRLKFQKEIFENMQEGVVLQDKSGAIVEHNSSALKVLGLSAEQIMGRTSVDPRWKSIQEDGSDFIPANHPAMVSLKTGKAVKNVVMGIRTPANELRWLNINSTPLFLETNETPSHAVAIFSDVSEQKIAQQMVMNSAKLSSLGEMAGNIAHEINTPLAIISSNAEQVLAKLDLPNPDLADIKTKVEKIEKTTHRIAQIVRGLRSFCRDSSKDRPEDVLIESVIEDALSLCMERFRNRGVTVSWDTAENCIVHCVPTQLSQVLLNLLINAHDAIADLDEKWIKIRTAKTQDDVQISIIDSGLGISDEILEKIKMPFFTTKPAGQGSGLGLSISKSIIESLNGRLDYCLEDGHTSFKVQIPIVKITE